MVNFSPKKKKGIDLENPILKFLIPFQSKVA